MTERRDMDGAGVPEDGSLTRTTESGTGAITRRALVRGAAVALPAVMTLHSGAAAAAASNMIVSGADGSGGNGPQAEPGESYVCLDTGGQTSGQYNLSNGNQATRIPVGDQLYKSNGHWITGDQMCAQGGEFKYYGGSGTPTTVNVPKGMLLSAACYASLAAAKAIDVIDI